MAKGFIIVVAILVALWGTGVSLGGVKAGLTGTAHEGAQSLTGHHSDWG
jgi:hypothetical protein